MITVEGDRARLERLRTQLETATAAAPVEPPLLMQGHQRLARLQQRRDRASNVLERFRIEQEMGALHQSLTSAVRDYEQRCREHRVATRDAADALRRAAADTYTRAHAQTMARVRARLAEAMEALDELESERLRLEDEYLLREANPFTHQRLAGLLRDARRIVDTAPATTRHSA